jgi:hypothetical protein
MYNTKLLLPCTISQLLILQLHSVIPSLHHHLIFPYLMLWWKCRGVMNLIWNSTFDRLWENLLELPWDFAIACCVGHTSLRSSIVNTVWNGLLDTLWELLLGFVWDLKMSECETYFEWRLTYRPSRRWRGTCWCLCLGLPF